MTPSNFTRRAALATGAAALATTMMPRGLMAQGGTGGIDAHCHAWSNDLDAYPMAEGRTAADLNPAEVPTDGLLAALSPMAVGRVVLIQHIWYHGFDSSYLTDAAKASPGTFAVVGAVGETEANGPDMMVEKKAEGVKGFRVRGFGTADWVDAPVMNAMYDMAAREGLNICPLIRNNANMDNDALLHLAALSEKHPDTMVVIDHMGTVMPGDTEQLNRLTALAKYPNVQVKISGFNKFDLPPYDALKGQIATLIDAFGTERLMWGSDLPVLEYEAPHNLKAAFDLVNEGLGLTQAEKTDLLETTAERAFF
ncbi:amidohydrolase family protein [Phaeobacter sp. J2-8]|uniref:amidohydrolase family protein n=1 Tax=Phaeobacter sp. J2-8 TaxID=2931394 RepID=UPI001FD2CDD6|nr:amidohydrolase family protein [Phaeobacter sp. J2-8]MCJ7874104.1 amidohydrolase [Phaeobacter sp. J2-8]